MAGKNSANTLVKPFARVAQAITATQQVIQPTSNPTRNCRTPFERKDMHHQCLETANQPPRSTTQCRSIRCTNQQTNESCRPHLGSGFTGREKIPCPMTPLRPRQTTAKSESDLFSCLSSFMHLSLDSTGYSIQIAEHSDESFDLLKAIYG